jgi:hypothetical protein
MPAHPVYTTVRLTGGAICRVGAAEAKGAPRAGSSVDIVRGVRYSSEVLNYQ